LENLSRYATLRITKIITMGFLQDAHGNDSSTRLLGSIVILYALVLSSTVIIIGAIQTTSILLTAISAGAIFTTIAGPAMIFMFQNKKEELLKPPI
jgi:hypothetical protein